ncbi:MAG: threonylcarbamoyl-AMP synthase [Bacteroidetes bacterium]|nr:MAG: threonylcarbamoyl-AMP synthase [Bacteroidota bacterium]
MIVKIYPDNPDPRKIDSVLECLRNGGVIIYPTDTVYSMGCDIMQHKAVERVAAIKGVKADKANFSIICNDLSHISDYTKPISTDIYKLMKKVLPGPFTFILNASNKVPRIFQNRKKTIGIRVPDNNIIRRLVQEYGNPIISTSIYDNDEILEYTTDPELIHENNINMVDMVIDGGYGGNIPSTVLDCTGSTIEVVRQGKGIIDDYL